VQSTDKFEKRATADGSEWTGIRVSVPRLCVHSRGFAVPQILGDGLMRAVLQRVSEASVVVDGAVHGAIGPGLLVLLGVDRNDGERAAAKLAAKCARLRIFEDEQGKMNRSLRDVKGAALVVSQFTLCADTSRGLRPSFEPAARPETARNLYEYFVGELQKTGVETKTGSFGAHMQVSLVNDGPVTIVLDSAPDAGPEGKPGAECEKRSDRKEEYD
jgi:D-tyrosyl-tRNA(Tyr) deacylase